MKLDSSVFSAGYLVGSVLREFQNLPVRISASRKVMLLVRMLCN